MHQLVLTKLIVVSGVPWRHASRHPVDAFVSGLLSRFGGCFNNIVLLNKSGQNDEDRLVDATKLYNKRYKSNAVGELLCDADAPFEHMSCWDFLKDFDKWDPEGKSLKKSRKKKACTRRTRS